MPAQSAAQTTGTVNYIRPPPEGEELFLYVYEKPENVQKLTNIEHVETDVQVTDLRSAAGPFSLEHNGFQLVKLSVPADINWDDQQEVESRYWPVAEKLLKQVTGATRVHFFDSTVRRGQVKIRQRDDSVAPAPGQPVPQVHVDYTTKSGPERLRAVLPEDAERLSKTPFAVIQVWRPLRGPVQHSPLGMIDASTVAKEDLLQHALKFPQRTGYIYGVAPNPDHRWYYAKGMNTDEAYVFVCYDSRSGRARFTPHTGFIDHAAPAEETPRESIEIRAYCFWENEPAQEVAL
ncbi:hypothetical protein WJX72_004881 [[Myrmecia] bisecta]|uniref:Methyltransferase n=1 Tax=[Myrmecia] bisecta TaxID=41462 RepID=A0AAW1PSU2_9CHLO